MARKIHKQPGLLHKIALPLDILIYAGLALLIVIMIGYIFPVMVQRLFYFGQLEHQEGIFLNTIRYLREGGNIYQPPDLHFAGVIYPPFYFFLTWPLTVLFGLNFTMLRALSDIAILGTAACAYLITLRITKNRVAGFMWLPLYLAIWPYYGWMDLARMEALFMFLIFAGACLLIEARGRTTIYAAAGICFGFAMATKQTGFAFMPLALMSPLFERKSVVAAGSMIAASVVVYGTGLILFGGSMFTWVFAIPGGQEHTFDVGFNILFVWIKLCAGFAFMSAACIFLLMEKLRRQKAPMQKMLKSISLEDLVFAYLILGGMAASAAPMFKNGSGPMNMALLNAFSSLAACYVLGRALRGGVALKIGSLVSLALIIFIFWDMSGPNRYLDQRIVNGISYDQYKNLVDFVRVQKGDVWLISHPWINFLAGKKPYVPMQQLGGEWAGGHPGYKIPDDVAVAISQQRFSMIVTGYEFIEPSVRDEFYKLLNAHYRNTGPLPPDTGIPRLDGIPMAPSTVWVPK